MAAGSCIYHGHPAGQPAIIVMAQYSECRTQCMAAAMLSMIATYIRHSIPSSKGKRATVVILTTFRFTSFGTTTRLLRLLRLLSAQLRVEAYCTAGAL